MKHALRRVLLVVSHTAMLCSRIALGIYLLPFLTAPESPDEAMLNVAADTARHTGTFHRATRRRSSGVNFSASSSRPLNTVEAHD
jgi:hypothetical protein